MSQRSTRREFLQTTTLGTAAAAAGFSFLSRLPRVSVAEATLAGGVVPYTSDIEPLVRLIEETPRYKVLEEVAQRVRHGTSYQEVLAALLLAGVRNVQPRPSVGFKFHCVLVVNSCHLASLAGPDEDRWLPIFWALDNFKSSQADELNRSGWRMKPVNESLVPDALTARGMFVEAMEHWDEEKADAATAGLVRHAGATEVFNLFARYAARDFRSIGHKAIFLANAWRTLQVIGWEYAEPVLRSLAFALMNHEGGPNPAQSDLAPDRPWRESESLAQQFSPGWLDGKLDETAARSMIQAFRTGSPPEAMQAAQSVIANGVSPQSVWDGIFVGAGELLMRQPGIVALHGLTSANAIHYLYRHVADDMLRRRLLLQACAFNALFLEAAKGRGQVKELLLEQFEQLQPATTADVEGIIATISKDKMQAATQVRDYLSGGGNPYQLIDAARRMIFLKGRDSHDYKFSSAVLEDFNAVSPAWRDRFLALSVFNLKGSGDRDSGLLERTRSAVGA